MKRVKLSTFCLIKGSTVSLTVLDPGMLVTDGYVDLMENGFSRLGGAVFDLLQMSTVFQRPTEFPTEINSTV